MKCTEMFIFAIATMRDKRGKFTTVNKLKQADHWKRISKDQDELTFDDLLDYLDTPSESESENTVSPSYASEVITPVRGNRVVNVELLVAQLIDGCQNCKDPLSIRDIVDENRKGKRRIGETTIPIKTLAETIYLSKANFEANPASVCI